MAIKSDKFEAHCIEMAKIAIKVGGVMDLKNDALQSCFATILISGDKHGVFLEPTPQHSKTPVIPPETAAVEPSVTTKGVETAAAAKDQQAAEKADEQIKNVPKTTTPEQGAGAKRSALLEHIEAAKTLLNKAGFTPPVTPKGLLAIVNDELQIPGNLGTVDNDDLEKIIMHLSQKLDTFRSNMKVFEPDF